MKMTVLDMVQSALRSIGSDTVNSIDDTQESYDAAFMLKEVYFNLIHERYWPHLRERVQPEASGDADKPTVMRIPVPVQQIHEDTLYYDKRQALSDAPDYQRVHYLYPDEFFARQMQLSNDQNAQAVVQNDVYYVYNDRAPEYFTSVDDEYLLFDAFDSDVDSTLQQSKCFVTVYKEPVFTLSDTFTPDLPSKNFPQLLAEFKSVVALELAQEANPKQEQIARRQRAWSSIEKYRSRQGGIRNATDFGRK